MESKSVRFSKIDKIGFNVSKSSIGSLTQSFVSKENIGDAEENPDILKRKIEQLNETLNQTKAQVLAYDNIYNNAYSKCKTLEKENALLQNATKKYQSLKKSFIAFVISMGVIIIVILLVR